MMELWTVKNLRVKNKRVMVRVDYNVPLDENGDVRDATRIKASLETLKYLIKQKPKQIIIVSHLGRPKGEANKKYSLAPVAEKLSKILKRKVAFVEDCTQEEMPEDNIVVLENLRFHQGEKGNDTKFARNLAAKADVYVNDAFGTFHRKHTSVDKITNYLPSCAGLLVEKELKAINMAVSDVKKPYVALIGAAKIADKIEIVKSLLKKVDKLLLSGAIVFTFMKAKGLETGKSMVEDDMVPVAKKMLKEFPQKIVLPFDFIVTNNADNPSRIERALVDKMPRSKKGVDIGPETIGAFKVYLKDAKTIVWNGPVGLFEVKPFDHGTNELARFMSKLDSRTIVGGGDTAGAINDTGLSDNFTHVSTGGGAFLEALTGKTLPGESALKRSRKKISK